MLPSNDHLISSARNPLGMGGKYSCCVLAGMRDTISRKFALDVGLCEIHRMESIHQSYRSIFAL